MSALTGRYSGSSETQMEQDSHLFHRADVVAAVEKKLRMHCQRPIGQFNYRII